MATKKKIMRPKQITTRPRLTQAERTLEMRKPTIEPFGQRLREIRIAKGLTILEAGPQIGFAPATVSELERGQRIPSAQFVRAAWLWSGDRDLLTSGVRLVLKDDWPGFIDDEIAPIADLVVSTLRQKAEHNGQPCRVCSGQNIVKGRGL